MEDKKTQLFVFRAKSGKSRWDWQLIIQQSDIEAELAIINDGNTGEPWELDQVFPVTLYPSEVKRIAGFLMGSQSSYAKAAAAKVNGKKGGRPKGTGKLQRAAAAAAEQAKLDTIPLNPEVIPVEVKKSKTGKKS